MLIERFKTFLFSVVWLCSGLLFGFSIGKLQKVIKKSFVVKLEKIFNYLLHKMKIR